jgi:hypothetical protein
MFKSALSGIKNSGGGGRFALNGSLSQMMGESSGKEDLASRLLGMLQGNAQGAPQVNPIVNKGSMSQGGQSIAPFGRNGDTEQAHVAPGEFVVPAPVLNQNPDLKSLLVGEVAKAGGDPRQYMVGNPYNKINPITGQPEFFWDKIKDIGKVVLAPVTGGASLLADNKEFQSFIPGIGDSNAIKDAERSANQGRQNAMNQLSPFSQMAQQNFQGAQKRLDKGFQNFQQDPGYQFRLQQGQQGMDRKLASMGLNESGGAIKAASDYNQGMASQEYGTAYNRWMAENQARMGLGGQMMPAVSGIAGLYSDIGDTSADAMLARQNSKNQLVGTLGGFGMKALGFA